MPRKPSDNPSAGITFSVTRTMMETLDTLFEQAKREHPEFRTRSDFMVWLLQEPVHRLCREWDVESPGDRLRRKRASELPPEHMRVHKNREPRPVSPPGVGAVAGNAPKSAKSFYENLQQEELKTTAISATNEAELEFPVEDIPLRLSDPGAKRPPRAVLLRNQKEYEKAKKMYETLVFPTLPQDDSYDSKIKRKEAWRKFESQVLAEHPVPLDFDPDTYAD